MNIPDTQNHLGNLETKPHVELQGLLHRQEQLLMNKKFINKLPDKGEKILQLVGRIKEVLDKKTPVDRTAELFEKMAIDAEQNRNVRTNTSAATSDRIEKVEHTDEMSETCDSALHNLVSRSENDKHVKDNRTGVCVAPDGYVNNYAKVISKSEKPSDKFLPSKSLKERLKDGSTPEKPMEGHLSLSDKPTSGPPSFKKGTRYDESLMFHKDFEQKFDGAKTVTVEESMNLQLEQQKRLEEFHAQHAAEKLAERLHIKVAPFNPEGTSYFGYRNQSDDSDDEEEAGDGENMDDYPD